MPNCTVASTVPNVAGSRDPTRRLPGINGHPLIDLPTTFREPTTGQRILLRGRRTGTGNVQGWVIGHP